MKFQVPAIFCLLCLSFASAPSRTAQRHATIIYDDTATEIAGADQFGNQLWISFSLCTWSVPIVKPLSIGQCGMGLT